MYFFCVFFFHYRFYLFLLLNNIHITMYKRTSVQTRKTEVKKNNLLQFDEVSV